MSGHGFIGFSIYIKKDFDMISMSMYQTMLYYYNQMFIDEGCESVGAFIFGLLSLGES